MTTEKQANLTDELNLKRYQPFGIPLVFLMFGIAVTSLIIVALYEIFF